MPTLAELARQSGYGGMNPQQRQGFVADARQQWQAGARPPGMPNAGGAWGQNAPAWRPYGQGQGPTMQPQGGMAPRPAYQPQAMVGNPEFNGQMVPGNVQNMGTADQQAKWQRDYEERMRQSQMNMNPQRY
jgi:hypothetical protein